MANNPQPSCPTCEYHHGTSGRPVTGSDKITCLDCGNSWKEFGATRETAQKSIPAPVSNKPAIDARVFKQRQDLDKVHKIPVVNGRKKVDLPKTTVKTVLIAASMICVAVLLTSLVGRVVFQHLDDRPLQIGQVKLQERVNSRGHRVFTVEGQLTNRSTTGQKIPKISIVLRQTNGHEVYRWHHNSPLPILRGGGEAKFASSVQHDNPLIAYAEAIFED